MVFIYLCISVILVFMYVRVYLFIYLSLYLFMYQSIKLKQFPALSMHVNTILSEGSEVILRIHHNVCFPS